MNYTQWLQWIATTLQIADPSGVTAFSAVVAMIIAQAEGRIYRDPKLDFLATRATDISKVTTPGMRAVALPAQFIVLEGVSIITPANNVPSQAGARRIPYRRATRSFLDMAWPVESQTQAPDPIKGGYYALFSQQQATPAASEDEPTPLPSAVLLMPTPDAEYRLELTGTARPAPLSATNQTTFLTTYLPDLFFAASMVAGAGYQRDFGAQSSDPQLAVSWDRLYRELRDDAGIEEIRKKSLSDGFSALPPKSATEPAQLAARAAQLAPAPQAAQG